MKKLTHLFLITFVFTFFSFIVPQNIYAVTGANCENPGLCGAAAVGCDAGEICEDTFRYGGNCAPSNGRCENRDDARAEICGFTNSTDGWCGESGGCAQGYMCNSTTQVCEPSEGCKNIENVYNRQCNKTWGTANQCGADGVCQYGYRCTAVPTVLSRTGYACRPDPEAAANKCPGSPSSPTVALACGQTSDNPNATCNCAEGGLVDIAGGKKCCGWKINSGADCSATAPTTPLICGQTTANSAATCNCSGASLTKNPNANAVSERNQMYCCGWVSGKNCASTKPATGGDGSTPTDPNNPTDPNSNGGGGDTSAPSTLDIFDGPNSNDFKMLNPIQNYSNAEAAAYFTSPGGIISRILLFAFPIAGLILFVMLVWAGFQILMGAASGGSKAIDAGKQRASTALIGFVLLFISYWVMQIIETIFGITIL